MISRYLELDDDLLLERLEYDEYDDERDREREDPEYELKY